MTLRAIKGGCLIKPDVVEVEVGGIAVPDYIQKVGRPSGILLQAATDNREILACLGKRVVIRTCQDFIYGGERYFVTKIDQLIAVVEGDGVIKMFNDGPERCAFCKSAGEGNMLLDNSGHCIVCGLDKYGQKREGSITHPKASKLTDDERERFGHTADYYLNKNRPKGKIYSFAGQTKRTHAEVPPLITADGSAKEDLGHRLDRLAEESVPKTWLPKDGKIISAASLRKRSRY